MAYQPHSDGDEYTAAWELANVMDQVIAQVTSATRPPGTAGQKIAETDTTRFQANTGSGWVQDGGWSASAFNAHTPQLDQGASTNIAKTVVYSQYQRYAGGNLCWWSFAFALTAAGTAGSVFTLSTPVTIATTNTGLGSGRIFDSSATILYNGTWTPASSTTIRLYVDTNISNSAWGVAPNLAVGSGDTITGMVVLPVA